MPTETATHSRLKALALAWAQANGFPLCASEVRVPRSGFRADVAACASRLGGGTIAAGPAGSRDSSWAGRTAIFECKQSRSDLLKDAHAEAATRVRLEELTQRRRKLEELLAIHRPDLRRGEALWPEYDTWDFTGLEHRTYRRLLAELAAVQRRVVRGTKFSKMFRYRCADFLYLVVEEGIFAEAEIPGGWGLLVREGGPEAGSLRLARPPANLAAENGQRARLLEAIALAATRVVNRAVGLSVVPGAERVSVSPPGEWLALSAPETRQVFRQRFPRA
jgi:hypothetical protein